MIVVMDVNSSREDVEAVQRHLTDRGLRAHTSEGIERTIIGVIGQIYPELPDEIGVMNAVSEVFADLQALQADKSGVQPEGHRRDNR